MVGVSLDLTVVSSLVVEIVVHFNWMCFETNPCELKSSIWRFKTGDAVGVSS